MLRWGCSKNGSHLLTYDVSLHRFSHSRSLCPSSPHVRWVPVQQKTHSSKEDTYFKNPTLNES